MMELAVPNETLREYFVTTLENLLTYTTNTTDCIGLLPVDG